jgi:hypothetical protein
VRTPKPGSDDHSCFNEPTLSELLDDPLIWLLMASDGVDPSELQALFAEMADLRARRPRET